jgi:hypothetical protein
MTFEEFQQLCNQAASTLQAVSSPCPIVVGDESASVKSSIGDTPFHSVVVFKMQPDNAAMLQIYGAVRFSFDSPNNQTVISPLTT